ncbi:MAG TPA: hypothetical protein PK468_11465 [Candidatus Hydrogenedentes bacterium]|nr:hypothetical protein [Candidatus Hydrogenedentota bacterium]
MSLISSWFMPMGRAHDPAGNGPAGVTRALDEGVSVLDLYFLDQHDIPWYRKAAGISGKLSLDPHVFAASLEPKHLDSIASKLKGLLRTASGGQPVGRRPRFAALATFFSNVSIPQEEEYDRETHSYRRQDAAKALANALYLARALGAHCVEAVGGTCVPTMPLPQDDHGEKQTFLEYVARRLDALADTIIEAYGVGEHNSLFKPTDLESIPPLAFELEPGPSLLLNHPNRFQQLLQRIRENAKCKATSGGCGLDVLSKVCLNVDIAHAFLIGYKPEALRVGEGEENLEQRVIHMHISDHGGEKDKGGAHAADLPPGEFHFYSDYRPWLELAIRRSNASDLEFSRFVAVELEACIESGTVLQAIDTTRAWLHETEKRMSEGKDKDVERGKDRPIEGALLTVDIGNSTECLSDCSILEELIQGMCRAVHESGGTVMSYTGDGFIALFEQAQFSDSDDAAKYALKAAMEGCACVNKKAQKEGLKKLTARAALHWGEVYVPTAGSLQDQVMGPDVVCSTRLCDWLSHGIEPAIPRHHRGKLIAATEQFHKKLPKSRKKKQGEYTWIEWGEAPFKGMKDPYKIFILAFELCR